MSAIVKFVHGISTCAKDIEGPFPVTCDLGSAEAVRSWIKKHTGESVPLKEARRIECGGWVFFPLRKRGSMWWSVLVRLDVEQVKTEAEACNCRRCRKHGEA